MDKTYLKFEQIGMSFRRGQMVTEVLRDTADASQLTDSFACGC